MRSYGGRAKFIFDPFVLLRCCHSAGSPVILVATPLLLLSPYETHMRNASGDPRKRSAQCWAMPYGSSTEHCCARTGRAEQRHAGCLTA
eukprot:6212562-Pleurochrysis_carterae.AAC.3